MDGEDFADSDVYKVDLAVKELPQGDSVGQHAAMAQGNYL